MSGIDFSAIKVRQKEAWSTGDYGVVGTTLQIVGETLCEALDVRSGSQVLDVAAGNGNATLAAARRGCHVTSTDYVPELLEQGRRRAEAESLPVSFQEADAENLPFSDASFDVVLSTFGVMFTPNQDKAAREMLRVCRQDGLIGLASWTPESLIGQVFKTIGKYITPPGGVKSPALWGTRGRLDELFGESGTVIAAEARNFVFRYDSPARFIEVFRTYYGPINKAFAALDPEKQETFREDLMKLLNEGNRSGDETLVIPSEYLEVVVKKS